MPRAFPRDSYPTVYLTICRVRVQLAKHTASLCSFITFDEITKNWSESCALCAPTHGLRAAADGQLRSSFAHRGLALLTVSLQRG